MKRFVVGNNREGKSDVLSVDDLSVLPHLGFNLFARDLWITYETPADLSSPEDPTINVPMRHEPPDGGTIFRVVRLPANAQPHTAAQVEAMHQAIQSVHVPSPHEIAKAKHLSMHVTDTTTSWLLRGESGC
jgi:hypothetical protein